MAAPMLPVTSLFAALLMIVYIALSVGVVRVRRGAKIALGDGGNKLLQKRIRAHGNFAEYVPFAVLLLGLVEGGRAASAPVTAALGTVLLTARLSHGWGVAVRDKKFWLRFLGTAGTFSVLLVESGLLLWSSLRGHAAA